MILFKCSGCGRTLKISENAAGKKLKCPGCGHVSAPVAATSQSPVPEGASRTQGSSPGSLREVEPKTLPPEEQPVAGTDAPTVSPGEEAATPPPADDRTGLYQPSQTGDSQKVGASYSSDADWREDELTDFLSPPQQPDEIGRLGPYRVLGILGAGGMGVVFKAEDPHLERIVALKAMLPSLAASAAAKKRFVREAKAAAAIKHHHIVTIFQVGEERGAPFLAMEYLAGEPLDERLKREPRLSAAEILRLGREIADGLAAAHDAGLIHRDIKPANIWLEERAARGERRGTSKENSRSSPLPSHVKILDFGLARALSDQTQLTQRGAIIGTPAYMAPEQATGKEVDHRCDLFSLGCVLYRMSTGVLPFHGNDTLSILSAIALKTPRAPAELHAEVPAALSDLIMRLLAKKPDDRPTSAHEVVDALQGMEAEHTQELTGRRQPDQLKTNLHSAAGITQIALRAGKRHGVLLGLCGGALLLMLLVWVFWPRTRLQTPQPPGEVPKVVAKKFRGEWVQLFNGRDLTGWKIFPGEEEIWRAEGGIIDVSGKRTRTPPPGCLFTERNDFENFHCRMEVSILSTAKAGFYFRTKFGAGINQSGYHIPICVQTQETGSLSGFVKIKEPLHTYNEWFIMDVFARGNHLVIKVNGKTAVDHVDRESTFKAGHLALQHVSGGIKFRKIEIMELPPGPGPFPDEPDPKSEQAGWVPLATDGDRSSWKVSLSTTGAWEIKDGIVTVTTKSGSPVVSFNDRKFKDFELKFQARNNTAKPAVWFRNQFAVSTKGGLRSISGPLVDLGAGNWGSLCVSEGTGKEAKILKAADFQQIQKVFRPDDFNDFHLKCVGKHCTIRMNGLITVDDDFPSIPDEGTIGIILIEGREAAFRSIFVRELDVQKN